MPRRLREEMGDILRELRPHAIWDAIKLVGLGVLAMLGVALTAILQRIRGVPPDMLGILILGGTWLLIVFAAYAFGKLRRNRAPAIEPENRLTGEAGGPIVEILRPLDLGNVGWHRVVSGKVDPPNTAVQVLVQSPNGAWYLQSTEVNGFLWTSNSQFGEKNRSGGSYKIIAVHGQTLSEEKYQTLDDAWIRSRIITVNRNSDNDIIDCPDTQLHQTRIADKHAIRKLVKV